MSKFEYVDFWDDYGMVFNASKYSVEEALEIFEEENGKPGAYEIEVFKVKIRWFPKMNSEELWYYDVDPKDNRGIYRVVEDEDIRDEDNKGFECWRVRYV